MLQDLRFAIRQLRRTPVFAVVAILTLALGIGANTAAFSVMNAVVLRFLPVQDPERLVFLHANERPSRSSQTGYDDTSLSYPVYEQLRADRATFADLIAFVPLNINRTAVRYGSEPETVWADMVTGNFFSGLGVRMAIGRGFVADDEASHAQVAVVSHAYWTRRFASDPSTIGGTIFVKGVPFTVVGVAAKGFDGVEHGHATDLWVPIQSRPELKPWGRSAESGETFYNSPNWWFLLTIGRLAPGVTQEAALARVQPIFQRAAYSAIGAPAPDEKLPTLRFSTARGIQGLRNEYERPLTILMVMVIVVLLIACGNVAMLLSARNSARQREFSLRTALGGNRLRLVRQLLTESLLLVAAGVAFGWILAVWATRALAAWSSLDVTLTPDMNVLAYTLLIAALAAIAFGLAPVGDVGRAAAGAVLRASAANVTADRRKVRSAHVVVVAQVALCLVLLVASGLLVRTMQNLVGADLGLRTQGLFVFGMTPPQSVRGDAAVVLFYQTLLARLRTVPGVESVTLMANRIGSGWSNNTGAIVDGRPPSDKFSPMRWNNVGPDYFHVLRIPLLVGRDFTDADGAAAPPVVIINETFAERYLAGRTPIGHHVAFSSRPDARQFTVVGVAANSRYTGVREPDVPMAYVPYAQMPGTAGMHIELRANGDPRPLLPVVRRVVQELGPDLPLLQPMTQEDQFAESFADERLFSRLAVVFGLLAAVLVATGLYGTLAYGVARRTSEIGVRIALGAERRQVLWMVLRQSLIVSAIGVAIGVPAAIAASRMLTTMLFGLKPGDPWSFGAAIVIVGVVAIGAGLVPARRAASVDPIVALRAE
jgi:predicted permease